MRKEEKGNGNQECQKKRYNDRVSKAVQMSANKTDY